jgi:DNA invertase Pin-like site-specific DNA recombinase
MIYGYARVSTHGQADGNSFEDQTTSIKDRYHDAEMFYEAESGAEVRPVFLSLLDKLQSGDVLVVTKLDRFCRSVKNGLEYIDRVREKGAIIHILNMGIVENTPMGNLIVTQLLAFAEFERAMIKERTSAGKAVARQKLGYKEGRPVKDIPNFEKFLKKQKDGLMTVDECCKVLGIGRSTWYARAREVS